MKEIIKYVTNKGDNLLFIGTIDDEEHYLEMDGDFKGWSFMGLRPNTEEELRERMRDMEPEDMAGEKMSDFSLKYFDYDSFYDDMEAEWEEFHYVQATREDEDGEILYLGFGLGTDIRHYFAEHSIKNYESYCNHFEVIGLTQKEYYKLLKQVGI